MRFLPFGCGIFLFGVALGIGRTNAFLTTLARSSVTRFAGSEVVLEGIVARYPDRRLEGTRFWLDIRAAERSESDPSLKESASGRVLVFADRFAQVSYGDIVAVSGTLLIPQPFDGFDYPAYLRKDGIVATLRARTIVQEGRDGSLIVEILSKGRSAIDRTATAILPLREGALLKAMLLGDEGSMTEEFKTSLNRSGLRHIVAVSGMNITILVVLISHLALSLGFSQRGAFLSSSMFIAAFVAAIGAPASAVRAALMALAMKLPAMFGRMSSELRAALFAATLIVFLSPLTLREDLGFQLSFLAVLGLILLTPFFSRAFHRFPSLVRDVLSATLAAQVAVFPLLLASFGEVSLIAPLTNLFVVPFLTIVTVVGIIAVGLGIVAEPLGMIAAFPLLPYLSFVLWIAERSASFPVFRMAMPGWVFALGTVAWYSMIGLLAWREALRTPRPIDLLKG
jgi:competence protein ComEC